MCASPFRRPLPERGSAPGPGMRVTRLDLLHLAVGGAIITAIPVPSSPETLAGIAAMATPAARALVARDNAVLVAVEAVEHLTCNLEGLLARDLPVRGAEAVENALHAVVGHFLPGHL